MSSNYEPYIVQQGEYLTQLAYRFGFDAHTVWNHPSNKNLKTARPDPNILAPMDVLYFPLTVRKFLPVKVGATNNFTATVVRVPLTLVFVDNEGQPVANAACSYEGLDEDPATPAPKTTDGSGTLVLSVTTRQVPFFVTFSVTGVSVRVLPGHLDPAHVDSGAKQRLGHLGYGDSPILRMAASHGLYDFSDAKRDSLHIAAFQVDQGNVEVTGSLTKQTADALKKAHGS